MARLLGRGNGSTLEICEMEESWPFKDERKIAEVIGDMAFNGDYFRNHPTLYLDWHQAMDEMEQLLSESYAIKWRMMLS